MTQSTSYDATAIIATYLAPGEQLLWAGRPKQGFAVRALDFWVVPFMICWSSAVVLSFFGLIRQEGQLTLSMIAVMVPILLLGVYMLLGRFWIDAKARSKTFYGVTSQRVIIIDGLISQQIHSIILKEILEVQFTHRSDGTGTLEFFTTLGGLNRFRKLGFNRSESWWPTRSKFIPPAFEMVSRPRHVEAIVFQAKENAQRLT